MTVVVPTLSTSGWVKAPSEKADFLLAHFYESDKFQTYLYGQNVTNLQYIIEQTGHDAIAVTQRLRTELETYLGRYYDSALVDVTIADSTTTDAGSQLTIRVFCRVTENGKDYSFGKMIMAMNSKLEKVVDLNNYEQGT